MPTTITESKSPESILLGLGTLGLAAYPLTSPVTFGDVGYIKQAGFSFSREFKDFESGGELIKRIAFRDRFELTAQFAEVKIATLNKIIPSTLGNHGDGAGSSIDFGGDKTLDEYAVRFEHVRTDGKIVRVDIWKAIPAGEQSLAFAEEDYITYPVVFAAQSDPTKAVGRRYGRISLQPA
jgi:hypothetical protein